MPKTAAENGRAAPLPVIGPYGGCATAGRTPPCEHRAQTQHLPAQRSGSHLALSRDRTVAPRADSRHNDSVMKRLQLTGLLEREGDGYVSLCPEFDVASQGATMDEALANPREAGELFLETASPSEVERRFHPEVIVSRFEATYA